MANEADRLMLLHDADGTNDRGILSIFERPFFLSCHLRSVARIGRCSVGEVECYCWRASTLHPSNVTPYFFARDCISALAKRM